MTNQQIIAELDRLIEESKDYNPPGVKGRAQGSIEFWSGHTHGLQAAREAIEKFSQPEAAHA